MSFSEENNYRNRGMDRYMDRDRERNDRGRDDRGRDDRGRDDRGRDDRGRDDRGRDDRSMEKESSISNKGKNKHDIPIINTTTLKINVKTNGDFTTKEYDLIPFHPNMSDVIDVGKNKNFILFPSFVKITMKDLKKSGIGIDYQRAFLDLDKYIRLIKYVTDPDKEDDPTLIIDKSNIKQYTVSLAQNTLSGFLEESNTDMVTVQHYEPLSSEEIISNNIGLIQSLFFPVKGKFFILGNEYIIGESNYIPPYVPSAEKNNSLKSVDSHKHDIPMFYTITIQLQLLDAVNNPGVGDFSRMSCKAKKESIAKQAQEVFGTNFGYVEEKKATIPSILHTSEVSKDRNFGKLQLEWEQRNKYQREPTTERERLEMERNMTPLQKKMAELERKQKELGDVPPLWEKETKELEMKKKKFEERIKELQEEYKNVTKDNSDTSPSFLKDLQNSIKDKMYVQVVTFGINITSDEEINKLKEELTTKSNPLEIKVIADFIKDEETKIDEKHIESFLTKFKSTNNEVDTLKEQEKNLKAEIKRLNASSDPTDKYNVASVQEKLLKIQADIRKKSAIVEVDKKKYGENGEEIIKGWKKILRDRELLLDNVNNEKKKENTRLKREIVDKELNEKFKKIKELNKDLLIAYFYEGHLENLTKREIEEYDREKRPDEDASNIISNLKSLEDDYLETASKVNESEKVQALLKLYSDYLNRLKKLKDGKEEEKKRVDNKLKDIARTLRDLKASGESTETSGESTKTSEGSQYKIQHDEEQKLIKKITDINNKLDDIKNKVDGIEKIITNLKKSKISNEDLKNKIEEYQNLKYSGNLSTGGRKHINKHKHKRKSKRLHMVNKKLKYRYKTRRIMKNNNKNKKYNKNKSNKTQSKKSRTTLRRLKNKIKKKKYTLRRSRI